MASGNESDMNERNEGSVDEASSAAGSFEGFLEPDIPSVIPNKRIKKRAAAPASNGGARCDSPVATPSTAKKAKRGSHSNIKYKQASSAAAKAAPGELKQLKAQLVLSALTQKLNTLRILSG
jgi:hypothetical protein